MASSKPSRHQNSINSLVVLKLMTLVLLKVLFRATTRLYWDPHTQKKLKDCQQVYAHWC